MDRANWEYDLAEERILAEERVLDVLLGAPSQVVCPTANGWVGAPSAESDPLLNHSQWCLPVEASASLSQISSVQESIEVKVCPLCVSAEVVR